MEEEVTQALCMWTRGNQKRADWRTCAGLDWAGEATAKNIACVYLLLLQKRSGDRGRTAAVELYRLGDFVDRAQL